MEQSVQFDFYFFQLQYEHGGCVHHVENAPPCESGEQKNGEVVVDPTGTTQNLSGGTGKRDGGGKESQRAQRHHGLVQNRRKERNDDETGDEEPNATFERFVVPAQACCAKPSSHESGTGVADSKC